MNDNHPFLHEYDAIIQTTTRRQKWLQDEDRQVDLQLEEGDAKSLLQSWAE